MREWCMPVRYVGNDTRGKGEPTVEAYRVFMGAGNSQNLPPGIYVVVRIDAEGEIMRTTLGPGGDAESRELVCNTGPRKLIQFLANAIAGRLEGQRSRGNETVH